VENKGKFSVGWQVEPKVIGGFPEWAVVAQANKLTNRI
jgi:hypothetical protein